MGAVSAVEIVLSNGERVMIDDEDAERVRARRWHRSVRGYVCGNTGKPLLHRFLMSANPGEQIDHINRNLSDCRKANLRRASPSQNGANRGLNKNNTSGYRGVSWDKSRKRWMAKIEVDRRQVHLGRFEIRELAALAYDAAAKRYFGEFASLNFPNEGGRMVWK